MFVARRAYRNYDQMVLPGSVVEPGSTKWFKTRLKDRKIVEINAHNFDEWSKYFEAKFGVKLRNPEEDTDESEVSTEGEESAEYEDTTNAEEPSDKDPEKEKPKRAKAVTVVI